MGIFQSAKCLYFAGIGQMLFGEVSQMMYCLDTIFTECPYYKLQATKSKVFPTQELRSFQFHAKLNFLVSW